MSDTLDSRDLEEQLNDPTTDDETKEAIKELKEECEDYGWEYGIHFINEYYWEDYCRDFAEDCGYLNMSSNDISNPLESCIDWEKWADLMKQDYSETTFEGKTYYYREA